MLILKQGGPSLIRRHLLDCDDSRENVVDLLVQMGYKTILAILNGSLKEEWFDMLVERAARVAPYLLSDLFDLVGKRREHVQGGQSLEQTPLARYVVSMSSPPFFT